MKNRKQPDVSRIMAFEQGELTNEETIDLFQELIDSGLAWQLQGFYGRAAVDLINAGHCTRKEGKRHG